MLLVRVFRISEHERGLVFKRGEFRRVLRQGWHFIFDPFYRMKVHVASVREASLRHPDLDVIARSGALEGEARFVDLKDHQRALVWVDDRFEAILGPGLHAYWTVFHQVHVEVLDARALKLEHPDLAVILRTRGAAERLISVPVDPSSAGLYFRNGVFEGRLGPGVHAFWRGLGEVFVDKVDLRERVLDVAGQEIMTADKVTLRLNAVVAYRVTDPLKAVTAVEDRQQALYREAQLALRGVVGTKELDELLGQKDAVADELRDLVARRANGFGLEVARLGIRDVILPGDMKELLNKVTEAKKAAEASLITRREEIAAMRSQANTARLLEQSPTLMRLRELEVLERVAEKANLNVLLGEQGLTDRVVKLL
ncbi:slipin family protein [Planctomycetota bacterium]